MVSFFQFAGRKQFQIFTSALWISRQLFYNTLIGEINQLGREEFHGVDCNIMIYNIYIIYVFIVSVVN